MIAGGYRQRAVVRPGYQLLVHPALPLGAAAAPEPYVAGLVRTAGSVVEQTDDGHVDALEPTGAGREPRAERDDVTVDDLVRIDTEHPGAGARPEGNVPGTSEVVVPVTLDDDRTGIARQRHGGIRRTRVVDHDLVAHRPQVGEQGRQQFGFVLGDDAGRHQRGRYPRVLVIEVSPKAQLGDGVTIGPFTVVHDDVVIGAGTTIGSHCVIGLPNANATGPLVIGPCSHVRSHSVLYQG